MTLAFRSLNLCQELRQTCGQSVLLAWSDGELALNDGATHFGYVVAGTCTMELPHGSFALSPGMYFSLPGTGRVGGAGRGIVVSRRGYRGFFQIGGPVEWQGRLRYIDGCSDSLLIAPVVKGDPCLNLLYLPPGTTQTDHTHPSDRIGVVISGRGLCRTPDGEVPLSAGTAWILPAGGLHSFHTTQEELRIVAYHPDSDYGPTHDNHPMLNRTLVGGVSAAEIPSANRNGGLPR